MKKARNMIDKIFKLLMKEEMRILPGHLAFFLVLTIIPLVALIATLAASLLISTESIRQAISTSVPKEVAEIIDSIITGKGMDLNILVFYFSAFILASNGAYSMINSSNEIYKLKADSIINRRMKAIIMTFILVVLFLFLLAVPVFGNVIFLIIVKISKSSNTIIFFQKLFSIIKYPIILGILFINIKLIYILAPDEKIPSKTTNKGALFTTVGWILSTEIFSFYIESFAKYDLFYGSISNILVLLLWIYLLSYIFVLGLIINASDYKKEIE